MLTTAINAPEAAANRSPSRRSGPRSTRRLSAAKFLLLLLALTVALVWAMLIAVGIGQVGIPVSVSASVVGHHLIPDYKMGPLSLMTTGVSQVLQSANANNLTTAKNRNEVDVSVEQAVAENPQVILLWDYGDKTNADSIKYLKSVLATTDAVKNGKLFPIKGIETFPGIRSADGVLYLAQILYPNLFPKTPVPGIPA